MNSILFLTRVDRTAFIMKMKEYISENNLNCEIIIASDNEYCCSQNVIDKFFLLPNDKHTHSSYLKEIILKYNVKGFFVASNFDIEILLKLKSWLNSKNITYFTPDKKTLDICLSKHNMSLFLRKINIKTPKIYTHSEVLKYKDNIFPLIIKPVNGQGSKDTYTVRNIDEFLFYYNKSDKNIIQEFIDGVHYTVDCFNNFENEILISIPRIRLVVYGANSVVSKVEITKEIQDIAFLLSQEITISGPWNFQIVHCKGDYYVYDINPRLSSGLIFGVMAGVPFHKFIVNSLLRIGNDIPLEYKTYDNILISKMNIPMIIKNKKI